MKIRNKTQNVSELNQEQQSIQMHQNKNMVKKNKLKTQITKQQHRYNKKTQIFISSIAQKQAKNNFLLLMTKTNQGVSFSKAKRAITQRTDFDWRPSPHQYHYESCQNKKRSPKFSFSKQKKFFKNIKQEKIKRQIPGPGKYQNKSLQKILGDVIGTSPRMSNQLNINNPGVGLYHIDGLNLKVKKGQTFQKSSRSKLQKISCAPGPNKYELSKNYDLKSFRQTFSRSKRLADILSEAPGIGTYKIENYQKRHSTSVRFTTSPRQSKRSKQKDSFPGPGNYEAPQVIKFKPKQKMQSAIFGSEDRQTKASLGPGPGSYNIFQNSQQKGVSLTGRNFYTHIQKLPSPNDYSPNFSKVLPKAQTARIGKQGKFKQQKRQIPGPSYYEPQNSQKFLIRQSGFVFSKSSRKALAKN